MLNSRNDVEAILLIGSTAFSKKLVKWDDFDVRVYTSDPPKAWPYYEILNDAGKHYFLSAFYYHFDQLQTPIRSVLDQKDVQILYGKEDSLRHIFVDRPRRIEPIPHELQRFGEHYEGHFEILVDVFFILNRYEARDRAYAVKPRLARDALRTFARHLYEFYGVDRPIRDRARRRTVLKGVNQLLRERKFEEICRDRQFVAEAIDLMARYI